MTIREVFNDLLLLLGYDDADTSPEHIRQRVFQDITAALQLMQSCGEDFYGREPITVPLTVGTATYSLGQTVQTVLEPVRLEGTGQPLRKLTTRGQVLSFGQLFLGQSGLTISNGTPLAYFVESLRNTASGASDSVSIVLHIIPPPDETMNVIVDAIKEPPIYTLDDLCDDTKIIPVPHKYVESIFLPVARFNLLTCSHFDREERKADLTADYERALNLLGRSDPRKPKPPESNSDAARVSRQANAA